MTKVTFPTNTPSIDDILTFSVTDLAKLPAPILADLYQSLDLAKARLDVIGARFAQALEARFSEQAAQLRYAEGKDTGTVRFAEDGVTITAELTKRVDWDQKKLAQIADNIASSGEDPSEFIDSKLSVSERKFSALPESWRKGFEPARTVRASKPKFVLTVAPEVVR